MSDLYKLHLVLNLMMLLCQILSTLVITTVMVLMWVSAMELPGLVLKIIN